MHNLKFISQVAQVLINADDFDTQMNNVLSMLGNYMNVSRAYVLIDNEQGTYVSNTYEWCSEGVVPQIEILQNINYEDIPSSKTLMLQDGIVCVEDIYKLPEDLILFLEPQGIKAILNYPLVMEKQIKGLIGVDECSHNRSWSEPEMELLLAISGIISSAYERKLIHDKIVSSENNFRSFFETIDDLFIVSNIDGKIIHANQTVTKKLGYSLCELNGMGIVELHPEDKRQEATTILQSVVNKDSSYCPIELIDKCGNILPVESRVWLGEWNNQDSIFGISKDISKEKEALEKFTKIFRNNPALMAIFSMPDGEIMDVNEAFVNKLKYSRSDVINKTPEEIGLLADDEILYWIENELQKNNIIKDKEICIKAKDRKDIIGLFSGEIIDNRGEKSFLAVFVDISDQKALINKIEYERQKMDNVINGTRLGTWEWNIQTGDIIINERWAEIIGYNHAELMPMKISIWGLLTHPEDLERSYELLQKCFNKEIEFYECEIRLRHKCGNLIWIHDRGKVLEWDAGGKPIKMFGVTTDITLSHKVKDELESSLKYEKLISIISRLALSVTNIDYFLSESIKLLGQEMAVDRAYLFEVDKKKGTMSNTFEWVENGVSEQKGNMQNIPETDFPWWVERLRNGEIINYKDIEEIPDEEEKENLRWQEIKSILTLPIFMEREYYGFIGFDNCTDYREWTDADINLLKNASDIITQYILRERYKEEILYISYHDVLTGLYNRRFMEENFERIIVDSNLPLAVLVGDVNGLKLTNDVFGHEKGDKLLIEAVDVLRKCTRKEDFIARWGGDEFLILMPRTNSEMAEKMIKKIKTCCSQYSSIDMQLSIAIGYSIKEKIWGDISGFVREAEESMYRQKLLESKSSRNVVINTLISTLFEKSMETEEHCFRLHKYCMEMGKRLGLTIKEMGEMELLARLHDIGKVGIRESVLLKPGKLTEDEWDEMKKHSEIGYRIAQNTPELSNVSEYILAHHERWDGNGYPSGLKGENIPLLCRILAVADSYDAMTNDRPYRKAMSKSESVDELIRCSGSQFDPFIVRMFLDILNQN